MNVSDGGIPLVHQVLSGDLFSLLDRFGDLLWRPTSFRQLAFPFGSRLERTELPGLCRTCCPLCGMGISHRFRHTRIEFFLMLAAVCERGKPDACLGGYFKIPDVSFSMDGRLGGRDPWDEQQRPDAQQAEKILEFQHGPRVLPGSGHDKAARMVSSGPLKQATEA